LVDLEANLCFVHNEAQVILDAPLKALRDSFQICALSSPALQVVMPADLPLDKVESLLAPIHSNVSLLQNPALFGDYIWVGLIGDDDPRRKLRGQKGAFAMCSIPEYTIIGENEERKINAQILNLLCLCLTFKRSLCWRTLLTKEIRTFAISSSRIESRIPLHTFHSRNATGSSRHIRRGCCD
jgi:hypothetical protein